MNMHGQKPLRMLNQAAARTMATRTEALSGSISCHAYELKLDVPFNRK
ncbi:MULTISPECIES: hypothetical protein [Paraburkholderia]|nr:MULTISPECIES: hypothetical protein [Paraburkholderia]MCX4164114.1 hypothetical protein [Paraburkholderia megapolitana]MDN7159608.1 hypothetical protein [Paraburkholderia sp. CHISQ3]MDQ6496655.1 hypothetical protein [Paraburkholderia megapolitana]